MEESGMVAMFLLPCCYKLIRHQLFLFFKAGCFTMSAFLPSYNQSARPNHSSHPVTVPDHFRVLTPRLVLCWSLKWPLKQPRQSGGISKEFNDLNEFKSYDFIH